MLCICITLSNNTKGLAFGLLHQVVEIYGKVYTSGSLKTNNFLWIFHG